MSGYTRVNAGAMQGGIDALAKANSNLQSALEDLKGNLAKSLGAWDGAAREQYQQVQMRWDQQAAEMNSIVQRMGQILGQISEGYDANEQRITQRWG